MMRKFIYISVLLFFVLQSCSQHFGNHFERHPKTIFDSVLVSEKGLVCIQYYNKLKSDYYKQDNYWIYGAQGSMSLSPVYTRKTPVVYINGFPLELYDFEEVKQFKKIIATEISPANKKIRKGEVERYGKIAFTAEK